MGVSMLKEFRQKLKHFMNRTLIENNVRCISKDEKTLYSGQMGYKGGSLVGGLKGKIG